MICFKCGAEIPEGSTICPVCHADLTLEFAHPNFSATSFNVTDIVYIRLSVSFSEISISTLRRLNNSFLGIELYLVRLFCRKLQQIVCFFMKVIKKY